MIFMNPGNGDKKLPKYISANIILQILKNNIYMYMCIIRKVSNFLGIFEHTFYNLYMYIKRFSCVITLESQAGASIGYKH